MWEPNGRPVCFYCPVCADTRITTRMKRKRDLEAMQEIARAKGGECIADEYLGKCKEGKGRGGTGGSARCRTRAEEVPVCGVVILCGRVYDHRKTRLDRESEVSVRSVVVQTNELGETRESPPPPPKSRSTPSCRVWGEALRSFFGEQQESKTRLKT